MLLYDDVDSEVMRCYHEMSLANLIYFAIKEGACSEQSSRMTAMDSASKNAGKQHSARETVREREREREKLVNYWSPHSPLF